jgi:hypothetical protein
MKSRNDFHTQKQYNEYLLTHYAGVALGGMLSNPIYKNSDMDNESIAYDAVHWAKLLVKELNDKPLNND